MEESAQRLRIKTEIMKFSGDLLETLFELAVGNRMVYPVRREIYVKSMVVSAGSCRGVKRGTEGLQATKIEGEGDKLSSRNIDCCENEPWVAKVALKS